MIFGRKTPGIQNRRLQTSEGRQRVEIAYHISRYGLPLALRSCRPHERKEKSLRFVHEMTNDETNEVVARTTLKPVHLDTEERRSCVFAGEIAAKVASMLPNNSNQ
jgi:acyl-CoA thioesterase FadM